MLENFGRSTWDYGLKSMAFPVRLVFTPFVVVVGGKYFLPVPECLLIWSGVFKRAHIFCRA
jgi:hypothetical protein